MADIVERLFEEAQDNPDDLRWAAADELEALRAKIAELERELMASDAALKESRANDMESMRQLTEALAKIEAAGKQEPLFWYRPVCDGEMYEGPIHHKSVGGTMLREEKPDEWKPLFTSPPITTNEKIPFKATLIFDDGVKVICGEFPLPTAPRGTEKEE